MGWVTQRKVVFPVDFAFSQHRKVTSNLAFGAQVVHRDDGCQDQASRQGLQAGWLPERELARERVRSGRAANVIGTSREAESWLWVRRSAMQRPNDPAATHGASDRHG